MDWIGDVSNFVIGATAHFIATVTTKVLSQPDVQDVFAETIALIVQKLLIQGSSSEEEEGEPGEDKDSFSVKRFQKQQKQALRLLGKSLLKMGESSDNLTRETEGDDHGKDIDIAKSRTEPIEEVEEENDTTDLSVKLETNTAPEQEPPRQETPTSVAVDLGKVNSPSFGTVETKDTVEEDYTEDPIPA